MIETRDFILQEAPNDVPTRCYCCHPARKLSTFRNGPKTRLAVCPTTRACIIMRENLPVLSSGIYTGSLDGV